MNKREERKLQIIELRNNYSPIARVEYEYNYFEREITRPGRRSRKKIRGVNEFKVFIATIYILIFIFAAITQMYMHYELTNLGRVRQDTIEKLESAEKEAMNLESEFISNYDLQQVLEKAKSLGFVEINNVKYINLNK